MSPVPGVALALSVTLTGAAAIVSAARLVDRFRTASRRVDVAISPEPIWLDEVAEKAGEAGPSPRPASPAPARPGVAYPCATCGRDTGSDAMTFCCEDCAAHAARTATCAAIAAQPVGSLYRVAHQARPHDTTARRLT